MTKSQRTFLENLVASDPDTTVSELRTALQFKFELDRTTAKKIIFEWLKAYPFKKIRTT